MSARESWGSCLARLEAGQLDPGYALLLKLAAALDTRPTAFATRAEALEKEGSP
jgi:transcriptional regulator with XRE-family HTH domain